MKPEHKDPSWALQKETFDRLVNHALLVAYKDVIFDEVPQDQKRPYIRVGEGFAGEFGARDIAGFEYFSEINVFCDNRLKTGRYEVKAIVNLVLRAMTDETLGRLNLDSYGFRNILQDISELRYIEEGATQDDPYIVQRGFVEFKYLIQVL
jgi:hypothetical protein